MTNQPTQQEREAEIAQAKEHGRELLEFFEERGISPQEGIPAIAWLAGATIANSSELGGNDIEELLQAFCLEVRLYATDFLVGGGIKN